MKRDTSEGDGEANGGLLLFTSPNPSNLPSPSSLSIPLCVEMLYLLGVQRRFTKLRAA